MTKDKIIDFNEKKQQEQIFEEFRTKISEEGFEQLSTMLSFLKELDVENSIDGDAGIMTILLQTLTLPDEEFLIMSKLILASLEKELNANAEQKLIMMHALELQGRKAEDVAHTFNTIQEEMDTSLKEYFSVPKINFLKNFFGIISNSIQDTEGLSKRNIAIPVEKVNETAKLPTYSHIGDAGMDVYANITETISLAPGEVVVIPTGIKVALPLGYELQVRPRSGMSLKTKIRVANSPGTIDSNYRDEIGVIIENIEPAITELSMKTSMESAEIVDYSFGRDFIIEPQQRIAQLVLQEVPTAILYEVDDVSKLGQDRGGGFGHSGDF